MLEVASQYRATRVTARSSLRFTIAVLAALILAACGGGDPVTPKIVSSVIVTPGSSSIAPGAKQKLSAQVREKGGDVLTGRTVTWNSGDPTIVTVDVAGLVTAVATGTTTVTASVDGVSGVASITVLPVAVESIELSPLASSISIAATQQLQLTLRDASGNVLSGRAVNWSSNAVSVATVDASGLVTGVGAGVATVSASSGSKSASATIMVTPATTPPVILAVQPAPLIPGSTVIITGTGFDPVPVNNVVTIGNITAPISSASATQLIATVPCVEGGITRLQITSAGRKSPSFSAPLDVVQRSLQPGESLILSSASSSVCNELLTTSASARYLISVFSVSTSANNLIDFDFRGNTAALSATSSATPVAMSTSIASLPVSDVAPSQRSRQEQLHWSILERNRDDYVRLRAKASALGVSALQSAGRSPIRAAESPQPGDMKGFFYTLVGGCSDTTRVIRGKAIFVGSRAIIWEDSANTLQSSDDPPLADYYRRLGEIFDRDQYDAVKNTFGDPLLRDPQLDSDGHVQMVFSQRLNGSGAAAYVTSCDQFPNEVAPASNFGEYFYGFVPTVSGSSLNSTATPDGWFNFMGRTVVHEVKHIASFSARVSNNAATFEQSWLEEGTARHAEEIWARQYLHHVAWKANTGYGTASTNGIYCDFNPGDLPCLIADPLRRPSYGMRRQFNEIRDKLVRPWDWSPFGDGAGQSGSVFYQTSWSLVRYTIDRYATSEAEFFHALINSNTSGATNLTTVAGASLDRLIGGWSLALYADDYSDVSSGNRDVQFATWNLRDIYAGLNNTPAWAGRFSTPYPIQPTQLTFGLFTSRVTGMRGGANAYFEISGDALPVQLLSVQGVGGASPSPNLRLSIVRLQ